MRIKKYLKIMAYDFWIMRLWALIPLAILWGVVPAAAHSIVKAYGKEQAVQMLPALAQHIIPPFALWWPMLYLKEFLESQGNELLFIHRKCCLPEIMGMYGLYMLAALGTFLYIGGLCDFSGQEWIRWCFQCFWYVSWFYLCSFLAGNITFSLALTCFYTMGCMLLFSNKSLFVYLSYGEVWGPLFFSKLLWQALLSAAVLVLGVRLNKTCVQYR